MFLLINGCWDHPRPRALSHMGGSEDDVRLAGGAPRRGAPPRAGLVCHLRGFKLYGVITWRFVGSHKQGQR